MNKNVDLEPEMLSRKETPLPHILGFVLNFQMKTSF